METIVETACDILGVRKDHVYEDSVKDIYGIEKALGRFYRIVSVTACSTASD